jgi:hypothetical protein
MTHHYGHGAVEPVAYRLNALYSPVSGDWARPLGDEDGQFQVGVGLLQRAGIGQVGFR